MTGERRDDWLAAIRWSATLVEPLMPLARRIQLTEEFRAAAAENRRWAELVFAGTAGDLGASLPKGDRWREAELVGDRAVLDDLNFGRLYDHYDLIPAIASDPEIDVALAAALDDLEPEVAVFVVVAMQGRSELRRWLENQRDSLSDDEMFDVATDAIRILTFRRRCMIGLLDAFVVDTLWWWGEQAHRLVTGEVEEAVLEEFSAERVSTENVPEHFYAPHEEWKRDCIRPVDEEPDR